MDNLIQGYQRFRAALSEDDRQRFAELALKGQKPKSLVIACSDSRVDPQMIFDAGPGELFVIRNVAALVPSYQPDAAYSEAGAAIEFAVRALEVEQIIVMGHHLCGGIRALVSGNAGVCEDFVSNWVTIAGPARDAVVRAHPAGDEQRQRLGEHEAIKLSLKNLMTYPWIAERVTDGRVELRGCWFDIATGELRLLDGDGGFVPVTSRAG